LNTQDSEHLESGEGGDAGELALKSLKEKGMTDRKRREKKGNCTLSIGADGRGEAERGEKK